ALYPGVLALAILPATAVWRTDSHVLCRDTRSKRCTGSISGFPAARFRSPDVLGCVSCLSLAWCGLAAGFFQQRSIRCCSFADKESRSTRLRMTTERRNPSASWTVSEFLTYPTEPRVAHRGRSRSDRMYSGPGSAGRSPGDNPRRG